MDKIVTVPFINYIGYNLIARQKVRNNVLQKKQ